MTGPASATRFLWRFAHPGQDTGHEREILVPGEAGPRSATVFAPPGWPKNRPAWVLLHGITVPGRHHDVLRRIARALAAAGHYAIAPEIAAWRELRVDPNEAGPAVASGLAGLAQQTGADIGRMGLVGFSVAGRWALSEAALQPGRIRAVVSMGGYWDIERTLAAMVTGVHDWAGQSYRYDPDPYGRWIMGANLLPLIQGDAFGSEPERAAAASSLHLLVRTAGQNGAMASTAVYDLLNTALRGGLPAGAHLAWDLLAPRSNERASNEPAARELVRQMADAGVHRFPLLRSTAGLERLTLPVVMIHGHADRTIPFTETLRLARNLPPAAVRRVTITRLFGHTRAREARPPRNPAARLNEMAKFAATIADLLAAIEE